MHFTQILSGILTIVKGPTGQDEGCPENEHEDTILNGFSLIWSSDHRTAQDKSESVDDNPKSKQFVDQVDMKRHENVECAGTKVNHTRDVIEVDENVDVAEAESTVQHNHSVQESHGYLLHY